MNKHPVLLAAAILLIVVILFVLAEYAYIIYGSKPVPAPDIPRNTLTFGSGKTLNYVVMGDSTTIGQGASYPESYAYQSAEHLAQSQKREIHFTNVGVSGARAADVVASQLQKAQALKPDLVLIGVGANDVTHFTDNNSVKKSIEKVITELRSQNPDVKVVITGSPAMGSVPRFPWPVRQIMGSRSKRLNNVLLPLVDSQHIVFAPIAEKTGPIFSKDPTLFAADKFHPNARGYAVWVPVINDSLDEAGNSRN